MYENNQIINNEYVVINPDSYNDCISCPRCAQYLSIKINFEKPLSLKMKCVCGYKENILLSKFVDRKEINKVNHINHGCSGHNYQQYKYYCNSCKCHFCEKCKKEKMHHKHKYEYLNKNINFEKLQNDMKIAHEHLNKYFYKIKTDLIGYLQSLINRIEIAYKDSYINNDNILSYIEVLYNHYNSKYPNYYLESNIKDTSSYTFEYFNHSLLPTNVIEHVNTMVNYFNNYRIIKYIKKVSNFSFEKVHTIHTNYNVNHVMLLKDGRIAACSDTQILIYNKKTYAIDINIQQQHQNHIVYLCQTENKKLISCAIKEIKIWTIDNLRYTCEITITRTHGARINRMIALSGNRIATCSNDWTIKIYNTNEPYSLIVTLSQHRLKVNSIVEIPHRNQLLSSSEDRMIKIWNLKTYQIETTIVETCAVRPNGLCILDKNRVIVGSNGLVKILNVNSDLIEQQKFFDSKEVEVFHCFYVLRDGNILIGGNKGRMYKYKLNSNTIKYKDGLHNENEDFVTFVYVNEKQFISCTTRTIKIWSY